MESKLYETVDCCHAIQIHFRPDKERSEYDDEEIEIDDGWKTIGKVVAPASNIFLPEMTDRPVIFFFSTKWEIDSLPLWGNERVGCVNKSEQITASFTRGIWPGILSCGRPRLSGYFIAIGAWKIGFASSMKRKSDTRNKDLAFQDMSYNIPEKVIMLCLTDNLLMDPVGQYHHRMSNGALTNTNKVLLMDWELNACPDHFIDWYVQWRNVNPLGRSSDRGGRVGDSGSPNPFGAATEQKRNGIKWLRFRIKGELRRKDRSEGREQTMRPASEGKRRKRSGEVGGFQLVGGVPTPWTNDCNGLNRDRSGHIYRHGTKSWCPYRFLPLERLVKQIASSETVRSTGLVCVSVLFYRVLSLVLGEISTCRSLGFCSPFSGTSILRNLGKYNLVHYYYLPRI